MTVSEHDIRTVGDLMTGDLIALSPVDNVTTAREILAGAGLHALPVIDRGEAVGVVTLADCENRGTDDSLGDVVRSPPITIEVDAAVEEAASLMRAEYVHHLLVTGGRSPEIIGIVSSFDLLAVIAG